MGLQSALWHANTSARCFELHMKCTHTAGTPAHAAKLHASDGLNIALVILLLYLCYTDEMNSSFPPPQKRPCASAMGSCISADMGSHRSSSSAGLKVATSAPPMETAQLVSPPDHDPALQAAPTAPPGELGAGKHDVSLRSSRVDMPSETMLASCMLLTQSTYTVMMAVLLLKA